MLKARIVYSVNEVLILLEYDTMWCLKPRGLSSDEVITGDYLQRGGKAWKLGQPACWANWFLCIDLLANWVLRNELLRG